MAMKKKNPAVAKRVADRKAFVKDKVASKGIDAKQARQRFYVQTRMAEMKAKGKTVTPEMRKELQKKFQSGNVSRAGFAAPKKKSGSSNKPSTVKPNPRDGQSSNYPPGYKPPKTRAKTSTKVPREAPKPTGARDRNRMTS
jgi:heme-binding NEAT domain protein